MKILKILIIIIFIFYKKVDDEPHAMAVFALVFHSPYYLNL